jgi:2-polyprenyl-3-methyl-5-hydroxy-6-metoxy-1,4-benzoquinol methylase
VTAIDRYLARVRTRRALSHIPKGASILDVGCHDGLLIREGDRRGITGIGLDPELDADLSRLPRPASPC